MRCPKCGYISFDKVTSCSKCETDVTEIASSLDGTGFQPMNNFFLGTLLPDFMTVMDSDSSSLQGAADDLNISMDDLDDFADIGDIPGESEGFGLGDFENESTISLQGVVVPEVDLSDFDDGDLDNVDTMQISAEQLGELHAHPEDEEDHLDLADVDIPEFDLDGVDLEAEDEDEDEEVSFSDEEANDLAESVEDMPSLDLEMEGEEEEMTLSVDDLDIGGLGDDGAEDEESSPALDLGDIDLSLGEDEVSEDSGSALADLDLADLEMEDDDLPDLKL